jgi:hypothetical protein
VTSRFLESDFVGGPGYAGGVQEQEVGPVGPEARFEDLVDALIGVDGVTPPSGGRGFGRSALRVHGRIFAMLVRGRLVLKLPAQRVDALVDGGAGVRFDANKGTAMKQWLDLDPDFDVEWLPLAREALAFVRDSR